MAFIHSAPIAPRAIKAALLACAAVFFSCSAQAVTHDDNALIEGAKLCTRYLPRHEREYGIPVHLLAAIASTESGRFHRALGMNLPWPWTINVEGQGYFFDTKEEAIAAVQKFQARGFRSIDVGCMQVNLHHHPYAFANLDQAFDPAYNVSYAAQFLKHNFEEEGSWRKATADYHSHALFIGEQYARLVFGAWSRIINKVADARAGRPILTAAATRETAIAYHDKAGADAAAAVMHKRSSSSYRSPHMHSISVSNDTQREKGVLVIRPRHDSEPLQQQAKLDDGFVTHAASQQQVAAVTPAPVVVAQEDKGAQIVKVNAARPKGQFEPGSHLVRVNSAADSSKSIKSAFVFDN